MLLATLDTLDRLGPTSGLVHPSPWSGVALWPWIVAVGVVAVVVLGFRRCPADDEPADVPAVPPVCWTPYDYPMGPVSSWPHVVDRPETVPTGSPADRSFVD